METSQFAHLILLMTIACVVASFVGGFLWSAFADLTRWFSVRPAPPPTEKQLQFAAKVHRLRAANLEIQAEKLRLRLEKQMQAELLGSSSGAYVLRSSWFASARSWVAHQRGKRIPSTGMKGS